MHYALTRLLLLCASREAIHQRAQGTDLHRVLGGIVGAGKFPPVPATVGVEEWNRDRLRIKDHELVVVGPALVAGVLDEGGAVVKATAGGRGEGEVALALLAPVQRNVHSALSPLAQLSGT